MNLTEHGADRIGERLGLPKRAVARMALLALQRGAGHSEFSGAFRRYLDDKYRRYGTANNMRVYSEHLFLFTGDTLITVWRLPREFLKAANRARKLQ